MRAFLAHPFTDLIDAETGKIPELFINRLEKVYHLLERANYRVELHLKEEGYGLYLRSPEECLLRDSYAVQNSDLFVGFPAVNYNGRTVISMGTWLELGFAIGSPRTKEIILLFPQGVEPTDMDDVNYEKIAKTKPTSVLIYANEKEMYDLLKEELDLH